MLVEEDGRGLLVTALLRLECIQRSDAESWAWRAETKQFCSGGDIMADIRTLYEQWEQEQQNACIPMEDLGDKASRYLVQIQPPAGYLRMSINFYHGKDRYCRLADSSGCSVLRGDETGNRHRKQD